MSVPFFLIGRGVAQLGLARLVRDEEAGGSNPLTPTIPSISRHRKASLLHWGRLAFHPEACRMTGVPWIERRSVTPSGFAFSLS